jgi:Glycosyl hydrolase family 59/Concanavalin A-like lectin/glucanases superfamily
MPPGLPYENRGLVTADQPWSGSYTVNAMTWAIAQFTQFVWPPWSGNPGGWKYVDSASGFLQGNRADGAYDTLVRSGGSDWSTIVETTSATSAQQASFTVTGGQDLAADTVHVWASNFNFANDSPSQWFVQQPSIIPAGGKFTITLQPGWVYSLTTTTGQGKGTAAGPSSGNFPLPYSDSLSTSGQAGQSDDEPQYLAAMDGAFELAPCAVPAGNQTVCTEQEAAPVPVLWGRANPATATRFPYAVIGDPSLEDYTVSCSVLLTQSGTSAGLVGRFSGTSLPQVGDFDGYVFDVSTGGAWKLIADSQTASGITTLASGSTTALGTNSWHQLALSMDGNMISASVDGTQVASVSSSAWTSGPAGIEAGAFSHTWPRAQYRDLSITALTNPAVAAHPEPG